MYVANSKEWDEDILGSDIVIAEMWRNSKGVDMAHKQGAKVIYEADDIIIGVGGKKREKLMDLNKEQTDQTIETISKCDAVTVTTQVLYDHYKNFNKNVFILPNYMDYLGWGKPWETERYDQIIRLGWAGSYSHHEDLMMITPVIEKVIREFPFVKFIYCGHGGIGGGVGRNINFGKDVFESIPIPRREFYPGVPVDFWPIKSKSLYFDIAIAPLLDDEFNAGKSCLKWLEYSANGFPGIYSDTIVYNKAITHGVDGLLAKNEDEWYKHIENLVTNEEYRKYLAIQAYKKVFTDWNLDDHYQKWINVYKGVL